MGQANAHYGRHVIVTIMLLTGWNCAPLINIMLPRAAVASFKLLQLSGCLDLCESELKNTLHSLMRIKQSVIKSNHTQKKPNVCFIMYSAAVN